MCAVPWAGGGRVGGDGCNGQGFGYVTIAADPKPCVLAGR